MFGPCLVFIPLIAAIVAFLLLTSPIDPHPYTFIEPAPKLEGVFAPNDKLKSAERLYEGLLDGPESIAYNPVTGDIFTGTADGLVWKFKPGGTLEPLIRTGEHDTECGKSVDAEKKCGRPKGMKVDAKGRLVVADCYMGIVRIDVDKKTKEILLEYESEIDDVPLRFLNGLDIGSDGTIYFTSSSSKWDRKDYRYTVIELDRSSRVFALNPDTKVVTVLATDMGMANGVALTKDENALLINEMTLHRVTKLHIGGPKKGLKEIIFDNLPGYPDNIKRTPRDTYYIGLLVTRFTKVGPLGYNNPPLLDFMANYPRAKKLMVQLTPFWAYQFFLPKPAYFLEISEDGKILKSFHDSTGSTIRHVGEACEVNGKIYLAGVENPYLGVVDVKDVL